MSVDFSIIIPARFASSRLPGKPLLKIGKKTLIEHVYRSASSSNASEVVIATDSKDIESVAMNFGARVIMTSSLHSSGTDRIAEALDLLGYSENKLIVNVQGDEYGLEPDLMNVVAESLQDNPEASIATLCQRITDAYVFNDSNAVKVIIDKNNFALYFSRSPIPWGGTERRIENFSPFKHIGIYAYHAGFLKTYANLQKPIIETQESLEQLRALFHGYKIYVKQISGKKGIEINTVEDLNNARNDL